MEGAPINIKRDGKLFQYIYDFLRYGLLPRDTRGQIILDASTRDALRAEADFFHLPQLIQECDQAEAPEFTEDLKIYRAVRDNIYEFKSGTSNWTVPDDVADLTDERNYDYNEPSEEDEYFEPEVQQRRVQSRSYMKFAKSLRQIIAPFTHHWSVGC